MRKRLMIIVGILLLNTFVFSEYTDQEEYQAQYYDNAKVLRVKYAQGETYVQRSYDEGFEEATVNLSIFEKDKIGTTEGRIEIYLGRLNFLRLDYDTEVEFERVPELRRTDMSLRIRRGGIYLDIRSLDNERDVEIQSPDCGVFLLNRGVYRINVTEGGQTEVLVYEGLAEVSGDDYSRNVRENQKIIMRDGRVTERPFYFYASNTDEFDRWNHERNSAGGYARYGVSHYLANGYEDYEYELSRNGRWIYNNSCREYTWIPYNIGSSWRPYYHGRWSWNPFYGYVWISFDSWGYFTHHYGRWEWDSYYGWYWIPGYHWSPAWVYWFWDNDYYGWCPVSRWNRPVIIINNHWNRNHDYHRDGIPAHSRSTVIIKKHNLGAAHIERVAVTKTTIREKNIMAKGFSPKERPALETVRVVNARGNTVVYKKSGFQESKNYQTVKAGQGLAKSAKNSDYLYRDSGSKSIEGKAFKYSKGSTSEKTDSSRTFGREVKEVKEVKGVKIEKKETPEEAPSGISYRSGPVKKAEKSNEASSSSSSGSERTFGREVKEAKGAKIEKKETPSEPKETKKTGTSGTFGRDSSFGTAQKAKEKEKEKEKEKDSPGFSSSERYYPSSKPSDSENSSSYRSSNRYNSYNSNSDTAAKSRNTGSSSETYVPSYRSKYTNVPEKSSNSDNTTPRERISYSSYKSYARPESSSNSSHSYSSSASSTPRYSSPTRSYSSSSGSSSSHSSYSAPASSHSSSSGSSSHSSYSGSSSSHSSHSSSSSSGSHSSGGGTAVKKHN